jgi:hypothetical protein
MEQNETDELNRNVNYMQPRATTTRSRSFVNQNSRNVRANVRSAISQQISANKFTIFVAFAWTIPMVVILILYWDVPCNTPLQIWLLVLLIVRFFVLSFQFMEEENKLKACLKPLLETFSFVWIIIGNVWVFTANDECKAGAVHVYKLALAYVIYVYIKYGIGCCFACCLYCCLPQIIASLPGETEAANVDEIAKIPVTEYHYGGNISEEDAVCAICLNNYQDNEKLSTLPCQHHFHQECVGTYLKGFNRLCPICRQDIAKGKDLAAHENNIVDTV